MQYRYGAPPLDRGIAYMEASEMCYVQYMPIMMPGQGIIVPNNLKWCFPIIVDAQQYAPAYDYMYLTAKHYFTNTRGCNRPGWHSDGFMTNDINLIWYDRHPTQFCEQEFCLTQDHQLSMLEMEGQAQESNIVEYPCGHIIKMAESSIHRVNPNEFEGMRTFVKVSLSNSKYNLKGNAHNHMLNYSWDMVERSELRNHPTAKAG